MVTHFTKIGIKYILCSLLFFSANKSSANTKVDSLLKVVQNEVTAMNDSLEVYKKELARQKEEVETITQIKSYWQDPWKLLKDMGLVVFLLASFLFLFWKWINKYTPNWYTTLIQNLIEKYEEVNVLKRKKRILIISSSPTPKNVNFINSFFNNREFNFEKLTTNVYQTPEKPFDIIFANNEDGKLSQNMLKEYLEKHAGTCLFYFGKVHWTYREDTEENPDVHKINDRVNLANSRAQIYGNLISTLKYHSLTTPDILS